MFLYKLYTLKEAFKNFSSIKEKFPMGVIPQFMFSKWPKHSLTFVKKNKVDTTNGCEAYYKYYTFWKYVKY